jgi:type IV pilus assembly protein PilF
MARSAASWWDVRRSLAWVALAWAVLGALGGCAAGAGDTSPTHDIVTESDEPEARRRARLRMELAVGYFQEGKTSVALDELKQVIAIDPSFPEAYNLRGLIYMRLGDKRQAEDSFRRAVSLNPRDPDTHHNYGWFLCQEARYADAQRAFDVALANPMYAGRAKTLMTQGVCQARAGRIEDAERSLSRSYELDAGNPVTAYNLARVLYQRGQFARAQFYIRRLNNTELGNAESLWLGIQVEHRLNDQLAMRQLGEQLKKRFGQSREAAAYDRKAFDE